MNSITFLSALFLASISSYTVQDAKYAYSEIVGTLTKMATLNLSKESYYKFLEKNENFDVKKFEQNYNTFGIISCHLVKTDNCEDQILSLNKCFFSCFANEKQNTINCLKECGPNEVRNVYLDIHEMIQKD